MQTKVAKHWPLLALLGLSLVGLVDALFLTSEHYTSFKLPCTVTRGCESVLNSQYAEIFGIPVALFGVIFYVVVLGVSVHYLFNPKPNYLLLTIWSGIGFVSSLYLVYLQAFVIKAWCQYCLLSAATTTAIFIISLVALLLSKKGKETRNESE